MDCKIFFDFLRYFIFIHKSLWTADLYNYAEARSFWRFLYRFHGLLSCIYNLRFRRFLLFSPRPYKNYLQTAALICAKSEHAELAQKLLQTGIVKISDGFDISNYAIGEARDGVFPLRCYSKLVSVEI